MKNTARTTWYPVPCPCGNGTIPGQLYEAGKRTCGNEAEGTKVRFLEATTGEDGRGRSFDIPAGTTGKLIKRINDGALYIKVLGRSTVAWTEEVEAIR